MLDQENPSVILKMSVTWLMEFLNGESTPHSDEVESWDAIASKNEKEMSKRILRGQGLDFKEISRTYTYIYSLSTFTCRETFWSCSPINLGQFQKSMTVLKSVHPEDSKTPPESSYWPSFAWDIWGKRQIISISKFPVTW